jgi:hypothetical protein
LRAKSNYRKWIGAGAVVVAGVLALAWQRPAFTQTPAQQRMDDAHPAGGTVDNRATAAELTATIAGSTNEAAGEVKRKNLIDDYIFGRWRPTAFRMRRCPRTPSLFAESTWI